MDLTSSSFITSEYDPGNCEESFLFNQLCAASNFLTLRSLPNFSFKISCKVPTPSIKPSSNDFFPDQNSPENNIE